MKTLDQIAKATWKKIRSQLEDRSRPLGAMERLMAIRNTADWAVRALEQRQP